MPDQSSETEPLRLVLELSVDEAWFVAQFLKRASFADYVGNAVDQREAYEMMHACERVRRQLAAQGIAPR